MTMREDTGGRHWDPHNILGCDLCGDEISEERCDRYDRNPNHHCGTSGHYCGTECYDYATGQVR